VAEHALTSLMAPPLRVAAFDVVVPLARLEHSYMPNVKRIVDTVKSAMEWA
jgi:Pyruvate/2-oxoglutarate dehydrogenase complex, dehydrogenase (E1) component, eukaryotic type, beta subunit